MVRCWLLSCVGEKLFLCVTSLAWVSTEATKKAFDAKVKENDDFVNKMKKEIDQAEKRAKEKNFLEKQVHFYKKAFEENEASITILQSELEKVSELQSKDQETHKAELETTRQAVRTSEVLCWDVWCFQRDLI